MLLHDVLICNKVASENQGSQTFTDTAAGTLQQLGQLEIPKMESNFHSIIIVGQIEGHLVLPPQNKTTKYEHIIPQLVAIEQNPS